MGPVVPNSKPMYPVGGYAPNAWGFYDMHGCVWQWTIDSYSGYKPGADNLTDPYSPMTASSYWPALRGGSYSTSSAPSRDNRSGSRYYKTYSVDDGYVGARIAIVKAP
jgi:formylglycine-generating enzyme required for sulfatase activity